MTIQSDEFGHPHRLHDFDGVLSSLHFLLLDMAELLKYQLEQSMHALDFADADVALKVISRDRKVHHFQNKIDDEAMAVLARYTPVANDLRTVVSSIKIAVELAKIGQNIRDFAELVTVLYDPNTSDPNQKLLADIIKSAGLINIMLNKVMTVLEAWDSKQAYELLQCDRECESDLQEGIKHQLALILKDARMIKRALDIMEMLKALEYCGEHCKHIAEYSIFMIDGTDIRHDRETPIVDVYINPLDAII